MGEPRDAITDELLVLGCQQGRAEAFRALIARWQEPLWRHAFRLTGRDDAAWDVVQDAWLGIADGIHKLRDAGRFPSWAHTIVTRRAADWLRRNDAESTQPLADTVPAPALDPDPRGAVELLRAALQRMPGHRRALLALRYVQGFEVQQIAEILGIPEGTAKSRLYHARSELREAIERMERTSAHDESTRNERGRKQ